MLDAEVQEVIRRVGNELSDAQVRRAIAQGDALADYLTSALADEPRRIGLDMSAGQVRASAIAIMTTGHMTNSGSSADLLLAFDHPTEGPSAVPISLKAYRGSVSSLGSKGAKASLTRLFLGAERVTDAAFVARFGTAAEEFLRVLDDFKRASKEFYASSAGEAFIDAYAERKKGSRKVNNPLRRKEVGDYFLETRGYKSEHAFADLYVQMFTAGMAGLRTDDDWRSFLMAMQFVLGMDKDILTLNAIAGADGVVTTVVNSYESTAYGRIRRALTVGCTFELTHRPASSIIGVRLSDGVDDIRCLELAIWKDATIQFKIDTKDGDP